MRVPSSSRTGLTGSATVTDNRPIDWRTTGNRRAITERSFPCFFGAFSGCFSSLGRSDYRNSLLLRAERAGRSYTSRVRAIGTKFGNVGHGGGPVEYDDRTSPFCRFATFRHLRAARYSAAYIFSTRTTVGVSAGRLCFRGEKGRLLPEVLLNALEILRFQVHSPDVRLYT